MKTTILTLALVSAALAKTKGNHVDRNTGSWTPIHENNGSVAALFYCHTDPQEAGNRTNIRGVHPRQSRRRPALRVDASCRDLLKMSVYPFAPADMEMATHPSELPNRGIIPSTSSTASPVSAALILGARSGCPNIESSRIKATAGHACYPGSTRQPPPSAKCPGISRENNSATVSGFSIPNGAPASAGPIRFQNA